MITTAVLPAPVLHGDSLPKPQMWASDHSGSIRAHLFQIHNEDKGVQPWSEAYAGNVGSQEKNGECRKQGMTDPEKSTRQH